MVTMLTLVVRGSLSIIGFPEFVGFEQMCDYSESSTVALHNP